MQSDKFSAGSALFNPIPGYRSEHYLKHCGFSGCNRSIPEAARIRKGPHSNWDDNVIWLYTTDYYAGVNKALFTNSEVDIKKYGGYVGELRRVIRKRCRGGLKNYMSGTVYRGMTLSEDIISKLKPGFTFLFPNLLSTSKNREAAFSGNVRLEIDLDKAKSVTFALHIANLSAYPSEDEVLFYPYSGFEVLGVKEVAGQVTIQLRPYSTLLMEAKDTGMSDREKVRVARERVLEIKGKGKGKSVSSSFEDVVGKAAVKGKGAGKGKVAVSVEEATVKMPSHTSVVSVDSPLDVLESAHDLQHSLCATNSIEEATVDMAQKIVDAWADTSGDELELDMLPQVSACIMSSAIPQSDDCVNVPPNTPQAIAVIEQDKNFRKIVKKVREIMKLEKLSASGQILDKMQAEKVLGKHCLFAELADITRDFSSDIEFRAKYKDILDAVASHASEFLDQEKKFRKTAKKVRELIKLENNSASGKPLNEMQAEKLAGKHCLFVELAEIAKGLPLDSELTTKNQDILNAVISWLLGQENIEKV